MLFSHVRAHQSAKRQMLLAGYKVYLTPNLKPDTQQMSDIIMCSGGEASNFVFPLPLGAKVIVVSCKEDLGMCRERMEAGQPVHTAELIISGVLRQQLNLDMYPDFFFCLVLSSACMYCSGWLLTDVVGLVLQFLCQYETKSSVGVEGDRGCAVMIQCHSAPF